MARPVSKSGNVRCPQHPGSKVVARGTYTNTKGVVQRFQCTPIRGERHTYTLAPPSGETSQYTPTSTPAPPACPEHPNGLVVRNGLYTKKSGKPRQIYRCYPNPKDKTTFHAYTPKLSRLHVHEGAEVCSQCEEVRGVHHGETTATSGRRNRLRKA
jgi:hypothetical protein